MIPYRLVLKKTSKLTKMWIQRELQLISRKIREFFYRLSLKWSDQLRKYEIQTALGKKVGALVKKVHFRLSASTI